MVVADSGPLIALARLSLLQLLPDQFGTVFVPDAEQFAARHLLDAGESAALLPAQSCSAPVLVDELKARRVAAGLGMPVVGTAGVLGAARMASRIGQLKPNFATLDQIGYRLSDSLIRDALRRTNED